MSKVMGVRAGLGFPCLLGAVAVVVAGCAGGAAVTVASDSAAARMAAAAAAKAGVCPPTQSQRWATVSNEAGAGAPEVRLPQPPNWDTAPEFNKNGIGLTLRNMALVENDTAPVLVVAVTDVTDPARSPEQLLQASTNGLEKTGASNVHRETGDVCGYPALVLDYDKANQSHPGRPPLKTRLVTVVAPIGGRTFNILVNAGTEHPENPTYKSDVAAMLSGLQIAAPQAPVTPSS